MSRIVSRSEREKPGGHDRGEGGAVLDEPPLAAVVPDEVRDLVDVRVRARRDRGEADGRQRREHRGAAPVRPVLREEPQRRELVERALEEPGREPVDHDQRELVRHHISRARGSAAPGTGRRPGGAAAPRAPAASRPRRSRRSGRGRARRGRPANATRKAVAPRVPPRPSAAVTISEAPKPPRSPPTAPAIASSVSASPSPTSAPATAPSSAASTAAPRTAPKTPARTTPRPTPIPANRPIVYQAPTGHPV